MSWTTPEDLKKRVHTSWERGVFLRSELASLYRDLSVLKDIFRFPLKGPTASEMLSSFNAVRMWAESWLEQSEKKGLRIDWTERAHRQLGRNRIPQTVTFESTDSVARYLGVQKELRSFREASAFIHIRFPLLDEWIAHHPFMLIENESSLGPLADLTDWYLSHPDPHVYLRQVSVSGVDTKFIERNRLILGQWWTTLRPQTEVDEAGALSLLQSSGTNFRGGGLSFARRFGFLEKPELVRFRILDPSLAINGYTDLSVSAQEFAAHEIPCDRVVIIENDVTVLSLPPLYRTIAIYGRGYGFDSISQARWLTEKKVWYWGDIDTHGFAILDQLRASFCEARSILMTSNVFLENKSRWVIEPDPIIRDLSRLSIEERSMYQSLCSGLYGTKLRLEQELLPWTTVLSVLESLD